ncbi:MAG: DUF1080 domain-containing protein [Mariniblastus sp.]|nr:DUF1080 domain-containing protein [Mariniblastus sp.]
MATMIVRQVANVSYLFLTFCFISAASLADQPNIVLILADDLGYGDCTAFNPQSKIKKPHVNAPAKVGFRFTDAHSASGTGTPSRSRLPTGIDDARLGMANTLLTTGIPTIHDHDNQLEAPNLITEIQQEPAQRLSEIFDGKSLDNWSLENGKPVPSGWEVNNGTIHRKRGKKRIGNIVTREQYGDFDLSFEWKIAKGGNSGIKYRVRKYGRKMLGYEYQIFDSGKTGQPPSKKDTGSIYALFEPHPNRKINPAGQFNTSRIVARGNRIDHWLNGQPIASATIGNAEWKKRVAESKFNDVPDFGRNAKGRIMLTDHGAEVWYRNLKISSPPAPGESNAAMPK